MRRVFNLARRVEGHDSYAVTPLGQVVRCGSGAVLQPQEHNSGYHTVGLYDGAGRAKVCLVHRLVALAFLPPQQGRSHVNHKDKDRHNNMPANLEWCSQAENNAHSGARDYRLICPLGHWYFINNLARHCREHGLHAGAMSNVASGKHGQHKGWRTFIYSE